MLCDDGEHDWQYVGGGKNENTHYTKWACECGAYKIKEANVIEDDSGTYIKNEKEST